MARVHIGGGNNDREDTTIQLQHPHIPPILLRRKHRHRGGSSNNHIWTHSKSKSNTTNNNTKYCSSSTATILTVFSTSLVLLQFVVFVQVWNHHVELHQVVVSMLKQQKQGHHHSNEDRGVITDAQHPTIPAVERKTAAEVIVYRRPSNTIRDPSNVQIRNNIIPKVNYVVNYGDTIYLNNDWNGSPVVIEEYKLIFFTTAKNGCSIFLQLLRRMMHIRKWNEIDIHEDRLLPWNPEFNGLSYLYDYNISYVQEIMTSPQWTRAIFVRDPKERFLSAYIDKVIRNDKYLIGKCCPTTEACVEPSRNNITVFLREIVYYCHNPHWKPQYLQMSQHHWSTINFVGSMDTVRDDTKRLLDRLGVWERYGNKGWGKNGKDSIFTAEVGDPDSGRVHGTNAKRYLRSYLTPSLEIELNEYYANDYNHPIMNLTNRKLF